MAFGKREAREAAVLACRRRKCVVYIDVSNEFRMFVDVLTIV